MRRHMTYANAISTLCLFLLLGGGTAVALRGSNTVFSDDIVNNQVGSVDVRDDTLSGPGGLRAIDLAPNSVGSSEVQSGSLTPTDVRNVIRHAARGQTTIPGDGVPHPVPLTNDSWVQQPQEVDVATGWWSIRPFDCSGDGALRALVAAYDATTGRLLDGAQLTDGVGLADFPGGIRELNGPTGGLSFPLIAKGSQRTVEIRATVTNTCNQGPVTLNSLHAEVVAFR